MSVVVVTDRNDSARKSRHKQLLLPLLKLHPHL
jgi:hypothetical protein